MSADPREIGRVAVEEADGTLASSKLLMEALEACSAGKPGPGEFDGLRMTPRHALELHRYIEAHRQDLMVWLDDVRGALDKPEPVELVYVQMLASRRFEFESAICFVEEAFIKPRLDKDQSLVLRMADWLCVDAFQLFVKEKAPNSAAYPLGPLVALNSRRSPAMWNDNVELSIPSLFDLTTQVRRSAQSSLDGLAVFPVISLPADLSRLPEYYALLAHEVGHAADAAFGLTAEILEKLKGVRHEIYWKAWMREIVADAAGVTLSGEAFALAWWRFVRSMAPTTDLTYSDVYPPASLRLSFLRQMLKGRGSLKPAIPRSLPEEVPIMHAHYDELRKDFGKQVLPLLKDVIFSIVPFPPDDERFTRSSGRRAWRNQKISWKERQFRLLPSVLTQAITGQSALDAKPVFQSWDALPRWLEAFQKQNEGALPSWQSQMTSGWSFTREFLPTLRPTILGPDGVTKTPPRLLLLTHHKIALVAATQKGMLAALKETATLRGKPWEQIDFYFASDALLASVEYYANGKRRSLAEVQAERDEALAALRDFFRTNPAYCEQVRFYFFDGPPVFGSFWDWDAVGGRIHISPQLAGIDLSKCSAIDHIWLQDMPTYTYDQYCSHLSAINERAEPIPR